MAESVEFHAKAIREAKTSQEAQPHLRALNNIGTPEAVDVLIKALEHESKYVAQKSARELGLIRDKRAVKPLIKALKNERLDMAYGSAWALGQIGKLAVPELIKTLKHENLKVLTESVHVLGKIGDKKALPALMKISGHKDKDLNKVIRDTIKKIQERERNA